MKDLCLLLRDYYATPEMRTIWTEENMLQKWLDVEAAIAWAQGEVKMIPKWASKAIVRSCDVKKVTPLRVFREFEKARHWIVSLVHAFTKVAGPEGEYFHLGTTTQDILDGGLTLQIRESYVPPSHRASRARIHPRPSGPTSSHHRHGRSKRRVSRPLPSHYGQKIAILCSELRDHIERLKECSKRLFYANVSSGTGAQSTFVFLSDLHTTPAAGNVGGQAAGAPCSLHQHASSDGPLCGIAQHSRADQFNTGGSGDGSPRPPADRSGRSGGALGHRTPAQQQHLPPQTQSRDNVNGRKDSPSSHGQTHLP